MAQRKKAHSRGVTRRPSGRPPSSSRRSAQPNARARELQQLRTLKAKATFLRLFAQCGNVLRSCQAAKIGRRTAYDWLATDEQFKVLYDQAFEDALDALEEEARRRAVDGVLKPVYQGGVKVGSIREYSDTLLITLLKGKRPDTYRERFEHTGKGGEGLTFTLQLGDRKGRADGA